MSSNLIGTTKNMGIPFSKIKSKLELDDILPFGRHQGYSVREILKDRPIYISWLIQNTSLKFDKSVHIMLESAVLRYAFKKFGYNEHDRDTLSDWYDPFDDVPF